MRSFLAGRKRLRHLQYKENIDVSLQVAQAEFAIEC